MRIYNDHPDIDAGDLQDTRKAPIERSVRRTLLIGGGILLVPLLLLALVLGSLPALQPSDIVRMDGYVGISSTPPAADLVVPGHKTRETSPPSRKLVEAPIGGLPKIAGLEASAKPAQKDIELREIAAVQDVAIKHKSAVGERERFGAGKLVSTGELALLQVNRQYSNVRAGPSTENDVLATLEVGTSVSVFGRKGDWLEVGINDGSAISGYMHKSLLGIVKTE